MPCIVIRPIDLHIPQDIKTFCECLSGLLIHIVHEVSTAYSFTVLSLKQIILPNSDINDINIVHNSTQYIIIVHNGDINDINVCAKVIKEGNKIPIT